MTENNHLSQQFGEPAVQLLKQLIAINTVNPPGNERQLQELLASYLTAAGFEVELLAAVEGRPNLIARLRGRKPGQRLCYLGHIDTVLADASEWRYDPWSGEVADGFIWGRGTLDMKGQVAAEVVGAATLAASGWRPQEGELMLVIVVDEETGGALGAQWLTENYPDKVDCDLLINEGGGQHFTYGERRYYPLCCAEKGVVRFTLTTDGRAGHASTPALADNALLKMAPVLEALANYRPLIELGQETEGFIAALGESISDPAAALANVRAQDPALANILEPMLGVTVAPTRIRASEKINVIPSRAQLQVDCRIPPGYSSSDVLPKLQRDFVTDSCTLTVKEEIVGNRSRYDTPLAAAIGEWIQQQDPGAKVAPFVLPGFTDSRWFREAFPHCTAYGFCPQRQMDIHQSSGLIHGADERADLRDIEYATRFFHDLPQMVFASVD